MKRALSIAGSDSGGGAGIQADLKTFTAFGVFGTTAITAITAQNTCEVLSIHPIPPSEVAAQIEAVLTDLGTDAVKTGMLHTRRTVLAVASVLAKHRPPHVVVDPVMISKSQAELLDREGRSALVEHLFPLCELLTPNLPEAELLLGKPVREAEAMSAAAVALHEMGPGAVLLKGGHLSSDEVVDLLYDGDHFVERKTPRIETHHTHGTGCTLSAALAACLALGADLVEAFHVACDYACEAIGSAPGLGQGAGPLNHLVKPKGSIREESD